LQFHFPSFPLSDPVLVFALAMTIFLVLPQVFERMRIPGLIGLIIAGAAIGPSGIGLLDRDATIVLLGTVGLLYLMFLVGLELDLNEFNRHRQHSVTFGILSFLLPQVTGTGLSLLLGYSLLASVLLGAMFASHTLIAYPIASRLGIVKTGAVTTVLGATLLTDMLALLVLAVVTGAYQGETGISFWTRLLATLSIYVAAVMVLIPRLGRWFFRRVRSDGTADYVFVLTMLFGFAGLAEMAGIEPIIGALLVGFALNRLIPEQSPLMNRIKFVGDAIFVPFFLVSVGMLVDVRAFADRDAWLIIGALVFAIIASKAVAAWVTRYMFGFERDDAAVMFGLSVSHAAATMAITLVGYEIGLFDEAIVNAIVVVILVTCLLGPWVVERAGRKLALREAREPYEPAGAPERVIIPVANPATSDDLLELALLIRSPESDEPLHPLMVVRGRDRDTAAEVAEAEKLLGHAVNKLVSADMPVRPLTRVDVNIASGIVRGIAETRSSIVVVGWDGGRTAAGQWIFGSVLDQILEQTRELVLVAKLGHPLNTTRRLVAILPPLSDRHLGLYRALGVVKRVASQLGAPIRALVVDGEADSFEVGFERVKPDLPVEFATVGGWNALLATLRDETRPDDLVVLFSARRGTATWQPKLERLPGQLASLAPESFVVVYPPELTEGAPPTPPTSGLPDEFPSERVIRLDDTSFAGALDQLLAAALPDPRRAATLRDLLVASEREFSNELIPGVVLPHARIPGLQDSILLVGVSGRGVECPGAAAPAHFVVLLVSPADRPEEHLRRLADVAGLLRSPERVREIVGRWAPEMDMGWLHDRQA
jgi:Kef-type K+ transport system membrane component KefB/mannitol/fructose-specific phosphotransferase system IIA component (Ntr-type)